MKNLLFFCLILIFSACEKPPVEKFSLSGRTQDIPDSTWLILENSDTREILDSALVLQDSFRFEANLPHSPLKAIFRTKNFSSYRFVWLEDRPMSFEASSPNFRKGKIEGSETESLSQQLQQAIDSLPRKERLQEEKKFVYDHPGSIVSASILSVYATTWGKSTTDSLFQRFTPENQQNQYGQQISRYISLNQDPQVGEPFVDFAMADPQGNLRKLSDFKGKTVLLEFWASGCGPCRRENPELVKTYLKHKPNGFEIFGVSLDEDKKRWLGAIEKDGLPWPQVSDLQGNGNEAALIYGINGIPDNFLIDREGKIIARNLRGEKLAEKLLALGL